MQRPFFSSSPTDRMSMASVLRSSLVLLDIGWELQRPVLQPLITYTWSRWIHPHETITTQITGKFCVLYWTSLLTDPLLYLLETITAQLITQALLMLVGDVEDGNSVIAMGWLDISTMHGAHMDFTEAYPAWYYNMHRIEELNSRLKWLRSWNTSWYVFVAYTSYLSYF